MDLSNVRIREHFGLVSNDTRTGQFTFLVSPPKNRTGLEKQDYVLVDHPLLGEACQILAIITEITSYEEVAGSTIGDKMGKMLATAEIVGYIDLRREIRPLHKVLVPPTPGCRVYVPLTKFLEDTFNRDSKGKPFTTPIELGIMEASSAENAENNIIRYFMDAQELTSKHTLISASAGAGKTHTAKVLIREIMGKTQNQIILFDPYNEYSRGLNEFAKITELKAETERETFAKEIKKGQITILNGYGLESEEKKTFYNESLKTILKLRIEEKIKPLLIMIEEAENLKGETLDQIIAYGRKIGISACLLTVHSSDLGGKLLAQIGNQMIGKTTDKEDLEQLENLAGVPKSILPTLAVGEWIINGINSTRPMKVQIK